MSWEVYNRAPDGFVITRALANFQRTIISGNSNDQYSFQGNHSAFRRFRKNGMNLF